jgi:outer membrane protein assembly factor BamB
MIYMITKFRLPIIILSILVFGGILSACTGGAAPGSWPAMTVDQDKKLAYVANGAQVVAVDLTNGKEMWRFPAEAQRNQIFNAPPIRTEDGQIIAGSYDELLFSIDENGQQNWVFDGATNRYYGGALAAGGKIYAPNIDYNLYALSESGAQEWVFTAGNALWAAPVTDGTTLFLPSLDHKLYALDLQTGDQVWVTDDLIGALASSPVLTPEGVLYIGTLNNEMIALESSTGKILWRSPVQGWIFTPPALADGVLYFGDLSGTIYAMNAENGEIIWQKQPEADIERSIFASQAVPKIAGTPLVLGDKVYFATESGNLYAADTATGNFRLLTPQPVGGKIFAPVQGIDDTILVNPSSNPAAIIAFDKDGNEKWRYPVKQ